MHSIRIEGILVFYTVCACFPGELGRASAGLFFWKWDGWSIRLNEVERFRALAVRIMAWCPLHASGSTSRMFSSSSTSEGSHSQAWTSFLCFTWRGIFRCFRCRGIIAFFEPLNRTLSWHSLNPLEKRPENQVRRDTNRKTRSCLSQSMSASHTSATLKSLPLFLVNNTAKTYARPIGWRATENCSNHHIHDTP